MSGVLIVDMTNEENDGLDGSFRQGFLCPYCMEDLGDLTILYAHVKKYHPKSATTEYAFHHLKGIFGKAKQKILQTDAPFSIAESVSGNNGAVLNSLFAKDDVSAEKFFQQTPTFAFHSKGFGVTRSHTEFYLKCRAPCINESAVKTNNLIIRLDKLINQCPSDSNKRKAFERETVPWVMDRDVSKCKACSMKFTLTRRRHHCRLCGEVICHTCSKFLSFIDARKLTNPAFAAQLLEETNSSEVTVSEEPCLRPSASIAETIKQAVSSESLQSVRIKSEKLLSSTLSLVKWDGTEVSLASLLQQDENEHLRICEECKTLLNTRSEKMDMIASPPMLVVLYERLRSLFRSAEKLATSYTRISDSLSRGETMYTLDSAVQLRYRLMELQKEIDSLSFRIEFYGISDEDIQKCSTPREQIIQKNIRNFALQTLQELVARISVPLSEEQYNDLQEKRRADIKRRTDMEKERIALMHKSSISIPGLDTHSHATERIQNNTKARLKESVSFASNSGSCSDDGWSPSRILPPNNPFTDEENKADPLQEQILNIKGYLKQAAEDGRLEEVEILERNLRDLEFEVEKLNTHASTQ